MTDTTRVRVLQFLPEFGLGGLERLAVDLARTLDRSRYELHFGCLRRTGELLGELTDAGVPVVEYPISKLYDTRAWRQRAQFAQYLNRQRIEIVHAQNFHASAFAIPAARWAGVPAVVASIHDTGGYLTPLQQRLQRLLCRLVDRIAVPAEAVRQYLITQGFDPRRIVVIHNGVDLSRFQARGGDSRLRQEFGLPPTSPVVAVFARLIPLKGLEYFLEAAALVAAQVSDARFLVVGDRILARRNGNDIRDVAYREGLERQAARLGLNGRLVFTGFRTDVPAILSSIAVSVLPSVGGEGLPVAALEAMAAGVPIVATAVGGNAEAVADGVSGLIVPPRDAHALGRAIGHLLEDPALAARLGAAGQERARRHFSYQRYAEQMAHFYATLLDDARRKRSPAKMPDSREGVSEEMEAAP